MLQNYCVYKLVGDQPTKIAGNTWKAHSNNSDIVAFYADIDTAKVIYARFVYQKDFNSNNIENPPVKYMGIAQDDLIDTIIPNGYEEDGYHLWVYSLPNSITGVNGSGSNLPVRVSFQVNELEEPTEYLGYITTDNTVSATINAELKVLYPSASADDYVNVLENTSDSFASWEFDGTDWIEQTDPAILNQLNTEETLYYQETIRPNSASQSEVVDRDITDDMVSDIATNATNIAAITGTQSGLMDKATYDVDDNGVVDKAEGLDNGDGSRTLTDDGTNWVSDAPVKADTFKVGTKELTDNTEDSTLNVKLNDMVSLQVGLEGLKYAYNNTGAILSNAKVVYLSGADTGRTTCALASNNVAVEALNTIAITTQAIGIAEQGFITQRGEVRDFDTTGTAEGEVWSVDDSLYLGENGAMTNVLPESPLYAIKMGQVLVVSATVGKIDVNIRVVPVFGEQYPVKITSPQVGETMVYNGVEFANAETQTVGAGKSVSFYIEDVIEVGSYELLSPVPLGLSEELDTATLTPQNTDVLISGYITAQLGRTALQAGTWVFDNFLRVNTVNGTTIAKIKVYQYETDTTETLLFEVATGDINTTTLENFQISTTQTEFTINSTDRLLIKYYGTTTSTNSPVITLAHSGTDNASKLLTPLQTVHNDLAELQGGNGTERYHLSAAELTRLNSEVVRTDLTNYTEDIVLTGSEKFYMEDGTTKKRTTTDGLATYIGSLSGSVINTGKYFGTGLGAHETAFIKTFTMLNTTNADLYYDLVDLSSIPNFYTVDGINHIIRVKIPDTLNDDSALMRISLDNGTTYKNVLFNGVGIVGSNLLGEEIEFKLTANGFEQLTETELTNSIPYSGAIGQHTVGANGLTHPITKKGLTDFDEVQGRTLQQIKENGDFSSGLLAPFVATNVGTPVIADNVATFTPTAQYGKIEEVLSVVNGQVYYITADVKTTDSNIIVNLTGEQHTGSGLYERLSGLYTASSTTATMQIYTNSTSGWVEVKVKNVKVIPLPSDITTVAQAEAMLEETYFEGVHTTGEARTYTQADYDSAMQEYIERDGTADGDTITGIYGRTVGKNKIDETELVDGGLDGTSGDLIVDATRVSSGYILVVSGSEYVYSFQDTDYTIRGAYFYDANKNYLERNITIPPFNQTEDSFTIISGARYVRLLLRKTDDSNITTKEIKEAQVQLELGDTATDYEAYEERYTHIKSAMNGIGGVYDTLDTQKFGVDESVLKAQTSWSAIDYTTHWRFNADLSSLGYATSVVGGDPSNLAIDIDGFILSALDIGDMSTTAQNGCDTRDSDSNLYLNIIKTDLPNSGVNGVADLVELLSNSTSTKFIYELATYIAQDIEVDGMNIVSPYSTYEQFGGGIVPKFYTTSAYSLEGMSDIQTGALIKHDKELDEHEGEIEVLKSDLTALGGRVATYTTLYNNTSGVIMATDTNPTNGTSITVSEDVANYDALMVVLTKGTTVEYHIQLETNCASADNVSYASSPTVDNRVSIVKWDTLELRVYNNKSYTQVFATGVITQADLTTHKIYKVIGVNYI